MRRRLTVIAAAAMVAAASLTIPQAANASVALPKLNSAPVPLEQIQGSVDYLRSTYGVTEAEAVRRLMLQRDMPVIDQWLAESFPADYAGSWLDQANGGVMVVAAVRPEKVSPSVAKLANNSQFTYHKVRHSAAALAAAGQRAAAAIGGIVDVTVDPVSNRAVVHVQGDAVAAKTKAQAGSAADIDAGLVEVKAFTPTRHDNCDPLSCTPPISSGCDRANCTPPLRAGGNIDLWSSLTAGHTFEGRCTLGFHLRGSNNWLYSSTAGHCMAGSSNFTSNNGKWVAGWQGGDFWGTTYPRDFSIQPFVVTGGVNYATYWLPSSQPRNYIWSQTSSTFRITAMYTLAQIRQGWVACSSGALSHSTRCGQVRDPAIAGGGIATNICEIHGDSGGPLFSQIDNRAYGLHSWDTTGDNSCPADYIAYYTPLSNVVGAKSNGVTISLQTS